MGYAGRVAAAPPAKVPRELLEAGISKACAADRKAMDKLAAAVSKGGKRAAPSPAVLLSPLGLRRHDPRTGPR